MSKLFITTTFSPMMLAQSDFTSSKRGSKISIEEISIEDAKDIIFENLDPGLDGWEVVGAVGHANTAGLISELLNLEKLPRLFNRVDISSIGTGDQVLAIVPKFRAEKSREFTDEELSAQNFRCFITTTTVF